jgi:VanZ family protein
VILLWAASPWWWPDLFRLLQSSIQRSYGYGLFEAPWYLRSDHQIHVLTTCALTLWMALLFRPVWWSLLAACAVLAAASVDEFSQRGQPGRTGSWDDWVASLIGILVAVVVIQVWIRCRSRPSGDGLA